MANELTHHGIKGQKWGVRRFQNKDGSLTAAGKKKYASNDNSKPRVVSKKSFWGNKPDVTKIPLERGELTRLSYRNKVRSPFKKAEDDRWNKDEFDRELDKYVDNFREKGEEYANKMLHERFKNYSYYDFQLETYNIHRGADYIVPSLTVKGNNEKNFYYKFKEYDFIKNKG